MEKEPKIWRKKINKRKKRKNIKATKVQNNSTELWGSIKEINRKRAGTRKFEPFSVSVYLFKSFIAETVI